MTLLKVLSLPGTLWDQTSLGHMASRVGESAWFPALVQEKEESKQVAKQMLPCSVRPGRSRGTRGPRPAAGRCWLASWAGLSCRWRRNVPLSQALKIND